VQVFRDKRQITATLAVNVTGEKLPGQLILQEKSKGCYPKVNPPAGWIYCHSLSHWQTIETTKEYLNKVIFPFFEQQKISLGLPLNTYSLIIWDIWHTHINADVIKLCQSKFIKWPIMCLKLIIGNFILNGFIKK